MAASPARVVDHFGWQDLESHLAVQPLIHGPVDHSHAACIDSLEDTEMRQHLADHLCHREAAAFASRSEEKFRMRSNLLSGSEPSCESA